MTELRRTPYEWPRVGGHLALDLGNTVSWRLDPGRRTDHLSDPAALVDWFVTVTASPDDREPLMVDLAAHPAAAVHALDEAHALRDALLQIADAEIARAAVVGGEVAGSGVVTVEVAGIPPPQVAVHVVAAAWRQALAVATPRPTMPLTWDVEVDTIPALAHRVALSVADLLHAPDQSRLRRCDGEACGWLFLDTTRNHSRRWCDPLDCGNRARVRAHAQRNRRPNRPEPAPSRP